MSRAASAPEVTQSVNMPEEHAKRVSVREWSLEVVGGPDKGKKVSTLDGLLRVGGDTTNDLVLTDTTVSRRHIEVERTSAGLLLLKDLGSRNGTWVDGRRIVQAYLEPGDKIQLGKTKIAVKQQTRGTEIEVAGGENFGQLVGASDAMRAVFSELKRTAREDMNLLIEGETGTGKELAARAVHEHSARRFGPFRVVDCSLLDPNTADKELFGNEGQFALAESGTLFLDEIAEVPSAVQPRLMRVIENREVHHGSGKPAKPINCRVIASSARNLAEEIEQGRFRKELFFRLAVARVRLPPLRTRKADIPVLAQVLMKKLGTQIELSAQTLSLLEGYDWPGNVRELRNVLERGALMQQTGNSSWLDFLVKPEGGKKGDGASLIELVSGMLYHEAKDRVLADFERGYFAEVMKNAKFDMKDAEARTGLSMQSLYRLLKKNGLRMKDLKNADGLS